MTQRAVRNRLVSPGLLALALLAGAEAGRAHDMFLVVPDHDLPAHAEATVALYNGTFEESLNVIDRERIVDVSLVDGAGAVSHPPAERWREEGDATLLELATGEPGTYVVGVSTAPNMIELTTEEFDEYLQHDGVLDVLEARRVEGREGPVRERYSKHVKTLLRVGDESSDTWRTTLGYPIEIVPLQNPSELSPGDALEVLVLHHGEPAAEQRVYASYAGYDAHDDAGAHREAVATLTDAEGRATIELDRPGRWYVRLIRMLPADDGEAEYESHWATLTFEVGR